ncbi:MAG: transcription elongation factor GreA [Bacteroidetes bacterium]|jgi:transcription elongation factor GreA|nr:transcription elongation factor GreA [Bacteroidota bacterium]MDA0930062.1 transcription elongation factor GreA [Bacteroidota bacterium]
MAYTYLTKEGYQKLKTELEDLVKERPKISAQIAEARDKGDLSENAEYDAAREAQGMLELRISKLQQTIDNARIIEEGQMDNSKVYLLSRVKIRNLKTKMEMTYQIVSEREADLKAAKISVDSPIGKGLLGKTVGDIADISAPGGLMQFEVISINA